MTESRGIGRGVGGGRPPFDPTPEQLEMVTRLAKAGVGLRTIALAIGCSVNTLQVRCRDAWEQGRAQGDTMIYETQFARAVKDGDVSMLKWLGIQRLNQTDKIAQEISGPEGGPVQTITLDATQLSDATLQELLRVRRAEPDAG